jgi:hypothetical protein
MIAGCFVDSFYYEEGQKLPYDSKRPCDVCFCIRGKRECTPKQCAPAIRGCMPKIPRGECCAIGYDCRKNFAYYPGILSIISIAFFLEYSLDKVISRELPMEHREEPSSGFDFLDLFFGPDNEADDPLEDSSSEFSEIISSTISTPTEGSSTTEKSFLDILRASLELIDANSDKIGAAIAVKNNSKTSEKLAMNKSEVTLKPEQSNVLTTTNLPAIQPVITQSPIKIINSVTAKIEIPASLENITKSTSTTSKPTNKKKLTDSPIKYVYLTTRSPQISKNSTTKYVPSNLIRTTNQTSTKFVEISTTQKPNTTTIDQTLTEKVTPSVITEKVTSTTVSTKTTRKITTQKPVIKPSRINDKVLDNIDDVEIKTESSTRPSTTISPNTTTSLPKFTAIITSTPNVFKNIDDIKNVTKNFTKISSNRPTATTESILTAFFSGLSSIFENPDILKRKPVPITATKENIQLPQTVESPFTPKPPVPKLPIIGNPLPTVNPTVNKPMPIPVDDYSYDYSDATLPSSQPNLKIIPFLPTDALDKVNYYKPNPIPLSENLDIYGSPGSTKDSEGHLGSDYGANYNPYDKDHYLVYSTIQDSAKDKTEISKLSITENYEAEVNPTTFPKFDKSKLNIPNHVRNNNKFIQDKYETLDYDFNPHEKIDTYDGDIKYVPSKYESAIISDYNKYGSTDITQSEKYYYGDGYESIYSDNSGGQFSPPSKTEGLNIMTVFSYRILINFNYNPTGGFIPKDILKNNYYYDTVTTKFGPPTVTEGIQLNFLKCHQYSNLISFCNCRKTISWKFKFQIS